MQEGGEQGWGGARGQGRGLVGQSRGQGRTKRLKHSRKRGGRGGRAEKADKIKGGRAGGWKMNAKTGLGLRPRRMSMYAQVSYAEHLKSLISKVHCIAVLTQDDMLF